MYFQRSKSSLLPHNAHVRSKSRTLSPRPGSWGCVAERGLGGGNGVPGVPQDHNAGSPGGLQGCRSNHRGCPSLGTALHGGEDDTQGPTITWGHTRGRLKAPAPCSPFSQPPPPQYPHSQRGRGRSSRHGCLPGCAAAVSEKEERRDTWSESDRSAPQVPQHPSHPSVTASRGTVPGGFLLPQHPTAQSTTPRSHGSPRPWDSSVRREPKPCGKGEFPHFGLCRKPRPLREAITIAYSGTDGFFCLLIPSDVQLHT